MVKVKGKSKKIKGSHKKHNTSKSRPSTGHSTKYIISYKRKRVTEFTVPGFMSDTSLEEHLSTMTRKKVHGKKLKVLSDSYQVKRETRFGTELYTFDALQCKLEPLNR